jgi:hypothetical protein
MKAFSRFSFGLAAAILMAAQPACSSNQSGGGSGGRVTGGNPGAGGSTGNGGATAAGGITGSGGVSGNSGGTAGSKDAAAGGATGAGGTVSAGGIVASGGTASGGEVSTGGKDGGMGGSAAGGAGGSVPDAAQGSGGQTSGTGGAGPGSGGAPLTGGSTGSGGNGPGGSTGTAGATGGMTGSTDGGTTGIVSCPDLPGAPKSPLYSITANGTPLFVEKMTNFASEMQVHYAHASLSGAGSATIAVTVSETFSSYKLSPKSRQIAATKSGNTVTFSSGPNYLIFQPDAKELLFILLDTEEANPPHVGDANVKSLADYTVDNTGATLVTSKIQSAINAASGATQNILYVPPGRYKVGELWLKSNMTMYLACGAIISGSSSTGDFNTGSGGIDIEGAQHALIRMYQIKNTNILGRGVLDSNGHTIRAAGLNANLLKIEQSSNITVDGIVSRDPSYWNTLVYRSDQVTIQNYKVINCRPTTGSTSYNQTDGVDFDESTNGTLTNAFLYTGDDGMAPKNEDSSGTINTKNILHEHIVVYNNSVGCKIGTKSMGQSMDGITFKDIDVVKAGRAMTIEAYDTAVVSNTTFEDIRVEAADSMLINLALDVPPTWRTAANTGSYKDVYFTNVSSDVKQVISLHGKSSSVNINGVHFKNFTIQGKAITSQTDSDASWDINAFVSNITFE